MTDEIIDHHESPNQTRPTFLTVLCVLTWIVSAYFLMTVPFNYFFTSEVDMSAVQSIMSDALAEMGDESPDIAEMMEGFMTATSEVVTNAKANAGMIAFLGILVALLSALGAYMMFNLKKQGFWIYLIAKVIGLISPIILLGANIIIFLGVSFSGFIGLIFIILYAVNRKHMS